MIQHFIKRFLASPKELFPRSIALKCDGRRVNLDAYEGIVILNIPYYGGGMNVWRQAMEVTPDSPALRPRTPSEDYMSTKLDSMMLESKNKSSSSSTFESLFCPSLTQPIQLITIRLEHKQVRE